MARRGGAPRTWPLASTPPSAGAGCRTARPGRRSASTGNALRYAALTGTVAIRWEGARQPTVWTVPPPEIDACDARLELARRYLHVFGPATPEAFAEWAGIAVRAAAAAFDALPLTAVRTPIGDAWILTGDEATFRCPP